MNFNLITNLSELGNLQKDLLKTETICFDIESNSLDFITGIITLIQFKINNNIYILDVQKLGKKDTKYILALLNDSKKLIIGHNLSFDLTFIYYHYGELFKIAYDTMLTELLTVAGLGVKYPSLKELVSKYCNVDLKKEVREEFYGSTDITQEMLIYAARDVQYLDEVADKQMGVIYELKLAKIHTVEMKLIPVIVDMKVTGITLDEKHWTSLTEKAEESASSLKTLILLNIINNSKNLKYKNAFELAELLAIPVKKKSEKIALQELIDAQYISSWLKESINLDSPTQVKAILNNVFNIPVKSTGEKVLKNFKDHEIIKLILDYREKSKLLSTYGYSFLENINGITGRIHASFDQLGTATGRMSSNNPNMQNIPAGPEYRQAFISKEGYSLIAADYSQAELRLLGAVSGEPEFINAYKRGEDLHKVSATKLFEKALEEITSEERSRGKTLNFATVYGTTEYGLEYNFGIPLTEGRNFLKRYFEGFKVLSLFMQQAGEIIWNKSYSITPLGRKRFFEEKRLFPSAFDLMRYKNRVIREGINHIIQGGSADIVKLAMNRIFYENPFGDKLKILLQIHDEIVCEVADDILTDAEEFIKDCMKREAKPFLGEIPPEVDAKVGKYWRH